MRSPTCSWLTATPCARGPRRRPTRRTPSSTFNSDPSEQILRGGCSPCPPKSFFCWCSLASALALWAPSRRRLSPPRMNVPVDPLVIDGLERRQGGVVESADIGRLGVGAGLLRGPCTRYHHADTRLVDHPAQRELRGRHPRRRHRDDLAGRGHPHVDGHAREGLADVEGLA